MIGGKEFSKISICEHVIYWEWKGIVNCASRFNLIQLIDHPLLSSPLIVSLVVIALNFKKAHNCSFPEQEISYLKWHSLFRDRTKIMESTIDGGGKCLFWYVCVYFHSFIHALIIVSRVFSILFLNTTFSFLPLSIVSFDNH